jgi:DNA-binding NtrC family response regulator
MFDVLIIDDTPAVRKQLARLLGEQLSGYRVHQAGGRAEGLRMVHAVCPNLVLLDLVMPSAEGLNDADWTAGRDLLTAIRRSWPLTRVLMLTSEAHRARQFLVEEDADDFFTKDDLRGVGVWKLVGAVEQMVGHFPCRSEAAATAREQLEAACTGPFLLITGEPGAGKRTLAQWVQTQRMPRGSSPVLMDVLALTGGASAARQDPLLGGDLTGLVLSGMEHAPDLPIPVQLQLAGLCERGVPGSAVIGLSERARDPIIHRRGIHAALRDVLAQSPVVELPPLRERRDDLLELAGIACRRQAARQGRAVWALDAEAAEALETYHDHLAWHGNLGDLDDLLAAAVARAAGPLVTFDDLALEALPAQAAASACTVLSLDIVESTAIKRGQDRPRVESTFAAFHEWVEEQARSARGEVYSRSGDGVLLAFPVADDALHCGQALLDGLAGFNEASNQLAAEVMVRIGLHTGDLPLAPRSERGRVSSSTLDTAAKLQEAAHPGELLVSAATHAALTDPSCLRPLRAPVAGCAAFSWS